MRIYFHRACFDGVASAAIAASLFEITRGERAFDFEPVDYSVRGEWAQKTLSKGSCIVDFLYHPQADSWWDHHPTTFVPPEHRESYERRRSPFVVWDPHAPSCAGLILRNLREYGRVPAHLEDLAHWADKLDAAQYESPEDAVLRLSPARLIALSFVVEDTQVYYDFIIRSLIRGNVENVVNTPLGHRYCDEARRRYNLGLELFRGHSSFDGMIVLYDVTVDDEIVDRMMPYYLFPQADYSLGIIRSSGQRAKLTCNASPWRRPDGPHLGQLFSHYGGGGHRDVGSALCPVDGPDPVLAFAAIARDIHRYRSPQEEVAATQ